MKITALMLLAFWLFPCGGPASAADAPMPAEAVEKAKALVEDASKQAARQREAAQARKASPESPSAQDELKAVSENAGFQKFLKIKNLCVERSPNAGVLAIAEDSRKESSGQAVSTLISNFRLWNREEAPVRKTGSCLEAGDYCSSSIWCCRAMACRNGVCGGGNSDCIPRGRPCGGSIWCCGAAICNDRGYCQ